MALNIDSFLPDEEECIRTLREMRWGNDGVVRCPSCNSKNVIKDGVRGMCQMYWCKGCNSYFNDRSSTIFQDTKVPLRKWFMIAFLMQFKIPVTEISKTVGISYRKSFDIVKKIRKSIYANRIVEKLRNHRDGRSIRDVRPEREKRSHPRRTALKVRGRGTCKRDKPPIIALISRESKQVIIAPSAHAGSEEVVKRAVKNAEPGATIYHDDYRSYNSLSGLFRHGSVNHSQHEYARGDVHINTAEAEFSVFRPWISQHVQGSLEGEALPLLLPLSVPQEQQKDGQGKQSPVNVRPLNQRARARQALPR